jgi:hypothetical protein
MDPTKHNYYKKLMALYESANLTVGSLNEVDICHDDWCAIYDGKYCNCDPEVKLRAPAKQARKPGDHPSDYEEVRPLKHPTEPCPHCGNVKFIVWKKPDNPAWQAISCDQCGAVMSSTHPLDSHDRPMRRP